jgi:hypothetical protein
MGLLVAAHSELIGGRKAIETNPYVEDGVAVHEATHDEMHASATMVGLWPYANEGDGDATLFKVETTFNPAAERMSMPVAQLALRLFDLTEESVTPAFDPTKHARHGDGLIFATNAEPAYILATDGTHIDTIKEGQIANTVGIQAALTGAAQIWLGRQGLVRVQGNSVYYVDDSMRMADIVLPEDGSIQTEIVTIEKSPTDTYDGAFVRNEQGHIVLEKNKDEYNSTAFSPRLPLEEAAGMLTDPIRWKDETTELLKSYDFKNKAINLLPLGTPNERLEAHTAQARELLLAEQRNASAQNMVADNLVVAALLQAIPTRRAFHAIDAQYYLPR